jgi:hypothetical protein
MAEQIVQHHRHALLRLHRVEQRSKSLQLRTRFEPAL